MLMWQMLSFRFSFVFVFHSLLSLLTLLCVGDNDYLYHYNSSSFLRSSIAPPLDENPTPCMASLCRGHITTEICQKCIASASIDVAQRCPTGYEAVIWYGQYMVRYSNRSIYSVMTTGPKEDLMINRDVLERVTQKFATKEVKFNEFQDVCRLAQCTPDISGDECNRGLQFAIGGLPECCSGKEAGFALYPSCILRYQITPFYYQTEAAAPPSGQLLDLL
ncbi:hypothetical protein SLE2022_392450 [Rubroshorea leprosula]